MSEALQDLFSRIGDIGVTCLVLVVVGVWLYLRRSRIAGGALFVVTAACMGLTGLLKLYFWDVHGMPELGLTEAAPSGHTSVNVVVYGGIAGILLANRGAARFASILLAGLALTIGFSRISEYGHSMEDVVFGLFLGGAGAVAVYALALHEERRFDGAPLVALTVGALALVYGSGFHVDADRLFHIAAEHLIG